MTASVKHVLKTVVHLEVPTPPTILLRLRTCLHLEPSGLLVQNQIILTLPLHYMIYSPPFPLDTLYFLMLDSAVVDF